MRRRLDSEDQAIFGMLLAGIDRVDIAATLRISQAGLDGRMWAMLHKLEGLGSDAGGEGPFGGPSIGRLGRRSPGC